MSDFGIDLDKWSELSVLEQMGNISSEVGRTYNAKRNSKQDRMTSAFYRGLDLIDATVYAWAKSKRPGLKELLRARDIFAESIIDQNSNLSVEKYFMQFAVAARRQG